MPALLQLEHGWRLSQRTFLFLHVTQDLGLGCGADEVPFVGGVLLFWRLFEISVAALPLFEVDRGRGGDVVVSIWIVEKSVST